MMYTGMKFFLDQVGVSTTGAAAAFSFYRDTNYLKSTSSNPYFNNLIFYKAGTINGYDAYYDSTNTYALWVSLQYTDVIYFFTYINDIGKDLENVNNFYDFLYFPSINPVTTYNPYIQLSGPFLDSSPIYISSGINNIFVNPDQWATSSSFGVLNTGINGSVTGNFFQYSGTGYFNGSTIMSLNKNLFLDNSMILLSYEKLRLGNEILLSSATGNSFSGCAGYSLGINDANKLYFKYWNPVEGSFTFTYDKILSDKNLVLLNKNDSIITLGRYNNNTHIFETQDFSIYNNAFQDNPSGFLYLGGNPSQNWSNYNALNFSGYIDKFFYFTGVSSLYKDILASGLYSVATGYNGYYTNICYTTGYNINSGFSYTGITGTFISGFKSGISGVTGYTTGLSGYSYSGITGYSGKSLGIYVDNCGNPTELFQQVAISGLISGNSIVVVPLTGVEYITGSVEIILTGVITGSSGIYVTGEICNNIFTVSGNVLYDIDINYLKSLSYSQMSLFSNLDSNDTLEVYVTPYQDIKLNSNTDLIRDNLNNYYINDISVNENDLLLYLNGQQLNTSGYTISKNGYETILNPNIDYVITGNIIKFNNTVENKDFVFYDSITGSGNLFYLSNYSSGTKLSQNIYENNFVFRNGQKLLNSIDYNTISSDFIQTLSGESSYDDGFGRSYGLNTSGSIIFIGSSYFQTGKGKVSIYKKTGIQYNLIQEITGSGSYFSTQMISSSDGKILTVSNDSSSDGRVYVYQSNDLNTWNLFQVLSGNAGSTDFGKNISLSPDGTVLVSSSATDVVNTIYTGSSWIYTGKFNNTWVQTQKITGISNVLNSLYWTTNPVLNSGGKFLCIGLDEASVGTDKYAGVVNVYIGISGKYSLSQILSGDPVGQSSGDLFGRSLGITDNGDILSIGSLHDNYFEKATYDGALFIFENKNDKFYLKQKLLGDATTGERKNDRFGFYHSITSDGSIICNSSFHDGTFSDAGAVWLMARDFGLWQINKKITGSNGEQLGQGSKISPDGTILITRNGSRQVKIFKQERKLSFNFNITGDSEIFFIKNNSLVRESGVFIGNTQTININNNFNNNNSIVFYNGIKQKLNNNYIENSIFDLLSGNYTNPKTNFTIYNNTNDFFV